MPLLLSGMWWWTWGCPVAQLVLFVAQLVLFQYILMCEDLLPCLAVCTPSMMSEGGASLDQDGAPLLSSM